MIPAWFAAAIREARLRDHWNAVDSWPRVGRLVHSFVNCPACAVRGRRLEELGGDPRVVAARAVVDACPRCGRFVALGRFRYAFHVLFLCPRYRRIVIESRDGHGNHGRRGRERGR